MTDTALTETFSGAGEAAVARATALAGRMAEICGPSNVLTDPLELRTYECDGLTSHRATPALVVLPETALEVAAVVRLCAAAGVPFVARGSGTGLSGGAVPHASGLRAHAVGPLGRGPAVKEGGARWPSQLRQPRQPTRRGARSRSPR